MKKIFVIVLNYNGGEKILACLQSLQLNGEIQGVRPLSRLRSKVKVPRGWQAKVIVVDNNSTNGSLQLIKQRFSSIKIIENKKNLGFAGGMNVGIKHALKNGAEAVLLLNQDTEVEKDFLGPLLNNPADVVEPVIKFKRRGKWVYDFGGRVNWWLGRTMHLEVQTQNSKLKTQNQILNVKSFNSIDYVSGCAMLIRRPVFEKIELLDERYFLYFEDVDFCLRAKKGGFKIAVEPKSIVFHHLKPTKKKPLWQNLHLLCGNLFFINRWIWWWRRPIAFVYWLGLAIKIFLIHP